jgi:hypothetical protein
MSILGPRSPQRQRGSRRDESERSSDRAAAVRAAREPSWRRAGSARARRSESVRRLVKRWKIDDHDRRGVEDTFRIQRHAAPPQKTRGPLPVVVIDKRIEAHQLLEDGRGRCGCLPTQIAWRPHHRSRPINVAWRFPGSSSRSSPLNSRPGPHSSRSRR